MWEIFNRKIEIEVPEGKEAKWVNGVLTLVDEQPKDITERIKTFEDACKWCVANGKRDLTEQYQDALNVGLQRSPDILAYLKLRIITCALNEGWEPTFEKGEKRWYNYYNIKEKFVYTHCACNTLTYNYHAASKLSFKSSKLSGYSATQFKDIYMDFCYKGKE